MRDFGLLAGKVLKRIQIPELPVPCFAYIAVLLGKETAWGQKMLERPDWRLFCLSPRNRRQRSRSIRY